MDITLVLTNFANRKFVSKVQLTPFQMGRKLYRAGENIDACLCDEMRAGWRQAENAGAWAYWQAMKAEGLPVTL